MLSTGMIQLEAADRLNMMQACSILDIPKMERQRILNNLRKLAYPQEYEQRSITHEEMARLLNG